MVPISDQTVLAMLFYLWDCSPRGRTFTRKAGPDGLDVVNLAAHILADTVAAIIRAGLAGGYVRLKERTSGVRGRIDPHASAQRWQQGDATCVCSFDRWSVDTPLHRYIASHLRRFCTLHQIAQTTRQTFRRQLETFREVGADLPADVTKVDLPKTHNFFRYKLATSVCRFLAEMARWTEDSAYSPWAITSARQSLRRQLHFVFEGFVRKFYAVELFQLAMSSQCPCQSASARVLNWPAHYGVNPSRQILLPKMITDTTLEFRDLRRILVVETKFTEPLADDHWDKLRRSAARKGVKGAAELCRIDAGYLRSKDLYQLMAYLHATRAAELPQEPQVDGLLLYPKCREDVDVDVSLYGFRLRVATVDLCGPWPDIRQRLQDLANSSTWQKPASANGVDGEQAAS